MNNFIVKPNKTVAELKSISKGNYYDREKTKRFNQKLADGYSNFEALYWLNVEDNCTEAEIADLIKSQYKYIYAPSNPEVYSKAEAEADVSEPIKWPDPHLNYNLSCHKEEPYVKPSIFQKIKNFLFYPVL